MNKKAKRFTSVLLTVLMALSMFMTSFANTANGFEGMAELSGAEAVSEVVAAEAAEEQAEQTAAPAEEIAEAQEEELLGAGTTYLAFTSDVHGDTTVLGNWLSTVGKIIGSKFDVVGVCGDLASGIGYSANETKNAVDAINNSSYVQSSDNSTKHFMIVGNHDINNVKYDYLHRAGDVKKSSSYVLYALGVTETNGNEQFTDANLTALENYLKTADKNLPVFVMVHTPLHYYGSRGGANETTGVHDGHPAKGSSKLIGILNSASKSGLKIFLLWGHNHSDNDNNYDKFFTDKINETGIEFVYCSAGAMISSRRTAGVQARGLVAAISDNGVNLTYYDNSGNVVASLNNAEGTGSGDSSTEPVPTGSGKYKETQSFENGKTYILTAASGGSVYALGSDGSGVKVTVDNGTIDTSNNAILWKAEKSGKGYKLTNVATNKVLGKDSTTLYFDGSYSINWGYETSSGRVKNADSTTGSTNGIGYANGKFSYPQNASDITLYAFSEGGSTPVVDPAVPSTETVEITPSTEHPTKTANIKVGEAVTVKLTNGSNNSAYVFEITSSNDGVARPSTGSINVGTQATKEFTITGASAGTATIKITNNNGTGSGSSWGGSWGSSWGGGSTSYERVATITVNVTGSGSDAPVVDPTDPSTTDITVAPTTEKPSYSAQIKAGETIDVNIYYESQNTSDNSWTFTLTSGNTSVAKVEGSASVTLSNKQTGTVKVKGVSEGTVKLTIQNDNTQYPEYTRYAYVNLTVNSAGADVPEVKTEVTVPTGKKLTYNGGEQAGVAEGIGYTLTGDKGINAGSYTATATLKTNYVWDDKTTEPKKISWSIEKATYDMSGVKFEDKTFPYDGKEHSIVVEGELPKGVEVTYSGNGQKEVGNYPVLATFTADETNYNPIDPRTKTAHLNIAVNEIDVPEAIENLTYTGKMLEGVPEGIGYTLSGHKAIDAGMYTATATLDENYMWTGGSKADKPIYWSIAKASYDMSGVTFESKVFPYDGSPKSIFISGQLPAGVSVEYVGNNQYTEGTHNVVAKFSGDEKNYEAIYSKIATITIVPNRVTVPSAKTNLVYSGREQTGVPEGAGYTLTGHKETNAGSYTAKAALKPGFTWADGSIGDQYIGWSIDKATYDMSGVKFLDAEFEYDGKEKSIEISGVLPAGVTVSYSGNKRTVEGSNLATAKFTVDTKNYNAIANMYATITIKKTSGSGTTGGGSTGGGSTGGGSTGGGSTGGGSGAGGASGGPTSAKGATATYSGNWYTDAAGIWRIKNNAGQVVANAWLCDDAVAANGQNVWYLLNADGSMIINGLVQDNTGNFYSIETSHNGYYGMLRYQDGYYDCNGQQVYLQFSRAHDGTFGAVINPEGIAALQAIYGVTRFGVDNSNCVYTAKF